MVTPELDSAVAEAMSVVASVPINQTSDNGSGNAYYGMKNVVNHEARPDTSNGMISSLKM